MNLNLGLIFNTKKKVVYEDELTGERRECFAGRMECMMQNIADSLMDVFDEEQISETLTLGSLSTFMVSNIRRKVTSSAKKKFKSGGSIRQTPEGSFHDLMLNARDILQRCGMKLPKVKKSFCIRLTKDLSAGENDGILFEKGTRICLFV